MTKPKKIQNGAWQVRFRDLDRIQRARNFKTKKEAEAFIIELSYELKHGTWFDDRNGRISFGELWPGFIGLKKARKPSTLADYESLWKVHLEPKWGKTPINRITQNNFDQWVISLNLSARRTRKVHLLASMIFDVAVKGEVLKRNPLKDLTGKRESSNLPVIPKRQVGNPLTLEQLFECATNAGYFEDHILFLGLIGARWGEFAALKVADLDLVKGLVRINKSISEINGVLVLSETTKNHQDREVQLADFLLQRAHKWIEGKKADDYLFTSIEGSVLRKANFSRRVFKPALEKAGLPKVRIHDLRWTAISIASSLGISQQISRVQVGHSHTHMTNAYTKIFPADQSEAVAKLDSAVQKVHKKCIDQNVPVIGNLIKYQIYAQSEANAGLNHLEQWLRQQNYESGALTN